MSLYRKRTVYVINAWQIGHEDIPAVFEKNMHKRAIYLEVPVVDGNYVVFDGEKIYIVDREQFEENYEKIND
ncbi:MAG: hypothetical protein K2H01_01570 [Ruminococcus sp.]|nr:hypothetical protein [Ruminococcus sp.]